MMPHLGRTSQRALLAAVALALVALGGRLAHCEDCNENGAEDAIDIASGLSTDCNGDGLPDECPLSGFEFMSRGVVAPEISVGALTPIDEDGDGRQELAVLYANVRLAVFRSDLDGPYQLDRELVLPIAGSQLVSGDFDADSHADLLIVPRANDPETSQVVFGSPDGLRLDGRVEIRPAGGAATANVADLDDDGDDDIIFVTRFSSEVAVYLADSGRDFAVLPHVALRGGVGSLVPVDLDDDDTLDLVVSSGATSEIAVLRGLGGGVFAAPIYHHAFGFPGQLQVFDTDSDGVRDVVTLLGDVGYAVFRGDGDRGPNSRFLQSPDIYPLAAEVTRLVSGDLDSDGFVDLVFLARSASALADWLPLRGRGDGTFEPLATQVAVGRGATLLADLDGDGAPELINADTGFGVFRSRTVERFLSDCDADGVPDACELSPVEGAGASDADGDGVPDSCHTFPVEPADCDRDGVSDADAITAGAADCNANGIPDACELTPAALDFRTAESSPGQGAYFVAADFDEDGRLDIVYADENRENATLRRGAATGFSPGETLQGFVGIRGLATGDFDADGHADLAIGRTDSPAPGVWILPGRGDGSFDPPLHVMTDLRTNTLAATDVNGDGADEVIAVGFNRSNVLATVFGDPARTFAASEFREVARTLRLPVTGDFNGDGRGDVVFLINNTFLATVYYGSESADDIGGLRLGLTFPRGFSFVNAGRVDGDDLDDLILSGENVRILFGTADGNFAPGPVLDAPSQFSVCLELTGDEHRDLVLATHDGGVTVAAGLRGGGFATVSEYSIPWVSSLYAHDQNGDGMVDVVTAARESVGTLLARGGGRLHAIERLDASFPTWRHGAVVTDLSGDGKLDVAFVTEQEAVIRLAPSQDTTPGAQFRVQRLPAGPGSEFSGGIAAGDFVVGDGIDLLVQRSTDRALVLLVQNPSGEFTPRDAQLLEGADDIANSTTSKLFALDFDGDGFVDIGAVQENLLHVFAGDGRGTFSRVETLAVGPHLDSRIVDVDLDGHEDVLVLSSRELNVLRGSPDGVRTPERASLPGDPDERDLRQFVILDADRDGRPDLVTTGFGGLSIWRGTGQLSFAPREVIDEQPEGVDVVAADFDGDGYTDLATVRSNDSIAVLRGTGQRGAGAFEESRIIEIGRSVVAMIADDLTRDGQPDLLVARRDSSTRLFGTLLVENISPAHALDCNGSDIPDACDIDSGSSDDANANGIPDECDMDCDANGVPDDIDLARGDAYDCDGNYRLDSCDIASGASDIDENGELDICQADCDGNGVPDAFDIERGDAIDCDENDVLDACDIATGARDVNEDGILDVCQEDCDEDGIPDRTQIAEGADDCDEDNRLDACQLAESSDVDFDGNGVLDVCQDDCNLNQIPDTFEIEARPELDCDLSGILDACEIESDATLDCNDNNVLDGCDIADGSAVDSDRNHVPDSCEGGQQVPGDCNQDGTTDLADALCLLGALFGSSGIAELPCRDDPSSPHPRLLDWQGDGRVNLTDAVALLQHLFASGPPHVLAAGETEAACVRVFGCDDTPGCQ